MIFAFASQAGRKLSGSLRSRVCGIEQREGEGIENEEVEIEHDFQVSEPVTD